MEAANEKRAAALAAAAAAVAGQLAQPLHKYIFLVRFDQVIGFIYSVIFTKN